MQLRKCLRGRNKITNTRISTNDTIVNLEICEIGDIRVFVIYKLCQFFP